MHAKAVAVASVVIVTLMLLVRGAWAQPSDATPPPTSNADDAARKERARAHFDRGAALVKERSWEGALAEFLLSRELYPTRGNTQNAAVCLRQLDRNVEALEMLEALLAGFPNLPAPDRAAAEEDIRQIARLVGAIDFRVSEAAAQVQVDRQAIGTSPLARPVRVKAGSHSVLVYKAGFVTFVSRIEVAGTETTRVDVKLEPLRESGRLRVMELSGRAAEVFVDGFSVGAAPWEGAVAIGRHTVSLRGEEGLGTQPADIELSASGQRTLTLSLEALDAELSVAPTPAGAQVAIDGVAVGSGVWVGRLRSGGHKVEVAQAGFLPKAQTVVLAVGQRERLALSLDRDPESPVWGSRASGHVVLEAALGASLGTGFGGDVSSSCGSNCSTTLPFGTRGLVHVGYELRSRLSFAVDAGYLFLWQSTRGRPVAAVPRGRAAVTGTADDDLALRGITVGASLAYHTPTALPVTLRLGAGALLGEGRDARTGSLPLGSAGATETSAARYGYIEPAVRIGFRLGEHAEALVGVDALFLVALSKPTWQDADNVVLGRDFLSFGDGTMVGPFLVVITPGIGMRYEL